MNKSNKTIVILVVIVLVLIVGYLLLSRGGSTPAPEGEVQGVETESSVVENGSIPAETPAGEVTETPVTE